MLETALLYITGKNVTLFMSGSSKGVVFSASPSSIAYLDVVDEKKLTSELGDFLAKNKIDAHQAVVVLDDSVLFTKKITSAAADEEKRVKQDFLEKIPCNSAGIVVQTIEKKGVRTLVATPRAYYAKITRAFEQAAWKITIVVPVTALGAKPTASNWESSRSEAAMFGAHHLFFSAQTTATAVSEERARHKRLLLILFISLLIVLIAGCVHRWLQSRSAAVKVSVSDTMLPDRAVSAAVPTIEVLSTSTPEVEVAVIPAFDKTTVDIAVLNGSGKAGSASAAAEDLRAAGYSSITTGNAIVDRRASSSEMIFGQSFTAFEQARIAEEIFAVLGPLQTSTAATSSAIDLTIILRGN